MDGWQILEEFTHNTREETHHSNNIFAILGVTSSEDAHSNFLKWLFDLLKTGILSDLKAEIFKYFLDINEDSARNIQIKKVTREEYLDTSERIDLIVYCGNPEKIILIENKIFHSEGEDQTKRYREAAEKKFKEKKSYIFLTPLGILAADSQYWESKSHFRLAKIIKEFLANPNVSNNEITFILNSYVCTIQWTVLGMMEQKIEIIKKYYKLDAEHRRAIDNVWNLLPPYSIYMDLKPYLESLLKQNKLSDRKLEISILASDEAIEIRNKGWIYRNKQKACYSFWLSPDENNKILLFLSVWGNKTTWWTDKENWEKYGVEPLKKACNDRENLKLENTDWGANKNYASIEFSLDKSKINNLLSFGHYDELIKELADQIYFFIKHSIEIIEDNWIPKD